MARGSLHLHAAREKTKLRGTVLIDAKGLFFGERLKVCSDEARLHWPWLYAAANGYGRLELNYAKLMDTVYASFRAKPSLEAVSGWLQEYAANFLVFVYSAPDGSLWAQFETSEKYLPRFKTAADRQSPKPDFDELTAFRMRYVESKKGKYLSIQSFQKSAPNFGTLPKTPEPSQTVLKTPEDFGTFPLGVGVGIGDGVGEGEIQNPSDAGAPEAGKTEPPPPNPPKTKPAKAGKGEADPRHTPFKAAIETYWRFKNPGAPAMPWDGKEAGRLGDLLKALPQMTLEQFQTCLNNRGKSPVNHGKRPYLWIEQVTDYANGPLDQFMKPIQANGGNANGASGNAAKDRHERSIDAIRQAAEKFGLGPSAGADGSDEGELSGPGAIAGNGGYVDGRLAGDGTGLRA